jgi:hypothetical protein
MCWGCSDPLTESDGPTLADPANFYTYNFSCFLYLVFCFLFFFSMFKAPPQLTAEVIPTFGVIVWKSAKEGKIQL